jgi:hypothetical protein
LEVELALFSRAFIRKRMISLASTASVAATSFALAQDPATTHPHHVGGGLQYAPEGQEEQTFLPKSAAMQGMMADMTIKPLRDIDRDFVEMLAPRHQGAIEMTRENPDAPVMSGLAGNRRSNGAVLPQLVPIDGLVAHGGLNRL